MGDFAVKDIRYTVLHVPFPERCADAMQVYGPDWSIVELIEVETAGVADAEAPGVRVAACCAIAEAEGS